LLDWTGALNTMDAFLSSSLLALPSLLQIPSTGDTSKISPTEHANPPTVDPSIAHRTTQAVLTFTAALLPNCLSKHVYNSTPHLMLLLSSPFPPLFSSALLSLTYLASPPLLHRQQSPEDKA
jgi:hypothetical protein